MEQVKKYAFLLIISTIISCRVGDNDPVISIYSRDKRITGQWKLISAKYEYYINSSGYTNHLVYKVRNDTLFLPDSVQLYSLNIKIDKNGTAQTTVKTENQTRKETGYWYWENNTKRKAMINFTFRPILFLGDFSHFEIDDLHNKRLVFNASSYKKIETESYFSYIAVNGTYTFEKVK